MSKLYWRGGLTGGSSDDLDGIDGADLSDGDAALVFDSGSVYLFALDATSGTAESSPDVISPDSNAGNKRWELQGMFHAELNTSSIVTTANDDLALAPGGTGKVDVQSDMAVSGDVALNSKIKINGLTILSAEASSGAPSGATGTITLGIPSGSLLIGGSVLVTTLIAGATTWDADLSGGSSLAIGAGLALAADTVETTFFDQNASNCIASNTTNITLTANGSSFTAGVVKGKVWYTTLDDVEA